jgi:RNA polymerase sigma-70 factor (ECF subfamily)
MQPDPDGTSEAELIARTIAGDRKAFALLVADHVRSVWRLSFHYLQDRYEAEEVFQETLLRAHRGLPKFRGQVPLRTWLLRICRNTSLTSIERWKRRRDSEVTLDGPIGLTRKARPEAGREDTTLATTVPIPASDEQTMARIDLRAALAQLPTDEQEAFLLIDAEQMTA